MGRIERIQSNTRLIVKGLKDKPAPTDIGIDEESIPLMSPEEHHAISARQKGGLDIGDWAQQHAMVQVQHKSQDVY